MDRGSNREIADHSCRESRLNRTDDGGMIDGIPMLQLFWGGTPCGEPILVSRLPQNDRVGFGYADAIVPLGR